MHRSKDNVGRTGCRAALALACAVASPWVAACGNAAEAPPQDGALQQATELHPLGVINDSPETIAANQLVNAPPPGGAPASVDMTAELPTPGDQLSMGSCVGWAVGYATKSFHEGDEEGWSLSTPNHQFSASWLYNQLNGGVDHGTSISAAMNLVISSGVDTLSAFPYVNGDFLTQPDEASFRRAGRFPARTWYTIATSEQAFKTELAAHNTVVIAISVLPDFDNLNGSTNTVYDDDSGSSRGRHAITVIGYDDAQGAFRFINSWGTGWGDGGYGWLAYSLLTNAKLNAQAYVMTDDANLPLLADADGNDCVNDADYQILMDSWNYSVSSGLADPRADFNQDDWVDMLDYLLLTEHWYEGCWPLP